MQLKLTICLLGENIEDLQYIALMVIANVLSHKMLPTASKQWYLKSGGQIISLIVTHEYCMMI